MISFRVFVVDSQCVVKVTSPASPAIHCQTNRTLLSIQLPLDDLLDAVGHVLHAVTGEARQRDASGAQHVNVVQVQHAVALLGVQTREAEHADLLDDVLPRAGTSIRTQRVV